MTFKNNLLTTTAVISLVALGFSLFTFFQEGKSESVLGVYEVNQQGLSNAIKTKQIDICYGNWQPGSYKNEDGDLVGFDIDITKEIFGQIGVEPNYVETTFGNMGIALDSGQCSMSVSHFALISRAASVEFTRPTFFQGNSVLIRKADLGKFTTLEDIDQEGVRVVSATGESGDVYAKDNFSKARLKSVNVDPGDLTRFMLEVQAGTADVAIADANQVANFARNNTDTLDLFAQRPFNLNPNNYGVRKGDSELLNFLNTSLDYLKSSGKWEQIMLNYDINALVPITNYQSLK